MANLKDIGYGVGKYLEVSDASAIPGIENNRKNLDLLNFKVATNNAYELYNFKDGMIDAYQTQDGVDTSGSTYETYDSTNKVYDTDLDIVETFTADGNLTIPAGGVTANILIVAGGGGGSGGRNDSRGGGAGGGAGGLLEGSSISLNAGTYTVTVGDGGAGGNTANPGNGTAGSNSVITEGTWGTATALGGGQGTNANDLAEDGGSGGGGSAWGSAGEHERNESGGGGTATQGDSNALTGYGYNGGFGYWNNPAAQGAGGGGGGAGAVGGNAINENNARAGGVGRSNSISGSAVTYGTGGWGAAQSQGGAGEAGAANTGDGGAAGRAGANAGGAGGSGIVIVTYTASGMTLKSNAQTANAEPTEGRLLLYEEDVDAITLDTDLKGYVSRDGGTTYTQTPLVEDTVYETQAFNQGGIDANTALMLHMDGSNGGTTFTDNAPSPHTIQPTGNINTSTAQKKFGTASCYLDGTGDYLRISTSGDNSFVMGSGNFTVDFWAYDVKVADPDSTVIQLGRAQYGACIGYVHSGGNFVIYLSSSNGGWQIASAVSMGALPGAAWVHYALVRNGNTWTTYRAGTQVSQFSSSSSLYTGPDGEVQIGRYTYTDNTTTNEMEGYIDELRVSKGVARWTADFTPPTSAYSTGAAAEAYTRRLVSGSVDISGQPAGTDMKYKVETLNQKNLKLHGASLLWA